MTRMELIRAARAAFPDAQARLERREIVGGVVSSTLTPIVRTLVGSLREVGWHEEDVHPEAGSFAVVRPDSGMTDFVGRTLALTYGHGSSERTVLAYCAAVAGPDLPLSLARRPFLHLAVLAASSVRVAIEVIDDA